jgi:L-ascorbate metabolism protein UlaG (beta-lactamase superfamily)
MLPVEATASVTPAPGELDEPLDRSRREELDDLHRQRRGSRRFSLLASWAGGWLTRQRRPVAEPLPSVEVGEVGLTWAGHATVLIRYAGLTIACDPMLGNRVGFARRAVAPGLSPAELGDVGLILVSNGDPDHLHVPTLAKLPRSATIALPQRCAPPVSRLGFARLAELGPWQAMNHRGVELTCVPVRHRAEGGRGACAWVLRGPGPSVLFCGASGYGPHWLEIARRWRIDVAILPIGGYAPGALRSDYMSPLDAVYAFEDLGARLLVPVRHGTFQLSYERLDEPLAWLADLVVERNLDGHVGALAPGASRKLRVEADRPPTVREPLPEE